MDWKQKIEHSFATRPATNRVRPLFRAGASEDLVSSVEETLNLTLPNAWRYLLFQTNGFSEELELSNKVWMETNVVAYSVEQILEVNRFHRDQPLYRDRNIWILLGSAIPMSLALRWAANKCQIDSSAYLINAIWIDDQYAVVQFEYLPIRSGRLHRVRAIGDPQLQSPALPSCLEIAAKNFLAG